MAEIVSTSKSKPNYEVRVGLFTLIAMVLLMYGWSWLKGISLFHPPQRFIVQFHDIAGLSNNAPVNVNGVRIGTVEKIVLQAKGTEKNVFVHLKINTEDVTIPKGSAVTIQTLGLVGAKYVEITLPEVVKADDPGIQPDEIIPGQDPIRTELYFNRLAKQVGKLDIDVIQDKLKRDLDHIDLAANSAATTLKDYGASAPHFNEAAKNFDKVAAKADIAMGSANTFFNRASSMTDDFRGTARRANKILDNPALSEDWKETATQARQAAEKVKAAITELNKTLGNQQTRTDLITMLNKLQASTENISQSIQRVNKIADDQGLRTDLKDIVEKTNTALDKVDKVVSGPEFGVDIKKTMVDVQNAATHLDQAAEAINERVSGPHWLRTGIIGGKVRVKKTVETDATGKKKETNEVKIDKSGTGEPTSSGTATPTNGDKGTLTGKEQAQ